MAVVSLSINDIFEEAYERIGLNMRSGYHIATARRSLNTILLEWQNRGLNLFTVDSGTQALTEGDPTYTMPTDTIDLIEHHIRTGTGTSQIDQTLERISVSTYASISAKNVTGRPTQIYVDRQATEVNITLWPVPNSGDYTLVYHRLQGIDGLSSGIGTSPDIPPRFIPALIAGLAFHLSLKNQETQALAPPLRAEYEFQYDLAAQEDQDGSAFMIAPDAGYSYG